MNRKVIVKTILGLAFLGLLALFNLIWKFSMGSFSSMNNGRQINVIASIVLVVLCGIVSGRLLFALKNTKDKQK